MYSMIARLLRPWLAGLEVGQLTFDGGEE